MDLIGISVADAGEGIVVVVGEFMLLAQVVCCINDGLDVGQAEENLDKRCCGVERLLVFSSDVADVTVMK